METVGKGVRPAPLGPTFKLVDRRSGDALGAVSVPYHFLGVLEAHGQYTAELLAKASGLISYTLADGRESVGATRFTLSVETFGQNTGALSLYGITPEEFGNLPGCAFSPSVAFVRRMMEKGA